jgi:hypothetical protein
VDVQRQYLSENLFRSIESAVTDSDGETIGHMIQNEQVYNFILSYYGETLGSFNNYRVQCENPSLYQCTITLNLASVTAGIPTFQDYGNVEQTFLYDNDTHTIYQTFTSTDGESKEVQQVVLKLDNYANTTICDTTTSGTSGTLTCVIPTIYQETAFYIDTYIDGEYVGTKLFSQGIEYDWMGADVLIILLMFTSLVLLFIGHPILIVIGAVLGLVLPVTLIYIASASFASIMGAVMYYVAVGVVIMIILRRKI